MEQERHSTINLSVFGSLSDYLTEDEIQGMMEKYETLEKKYGQFIVNLLKERAGLKMHCAEYKRKYNALRRIMLGELSSKIEGLGVQRSIITSRLRQETDEKQREMIKGILKHLSSTQEDLEMIYKLCREVSK